MLTTDDRMWFQDHPDREYRLRRQTPGEVARWPVQLTPGLVAWCIIRSKTGAMEVFASDPAATWCDCDECLEGFFAHLTEEAA